MFMDLCREYLNDWLDMILQSLITLPYYRPVLKMSIGFCCQFSLPAYMTGLSN
jgi:hypothetical protein